ncbi:MAG: aldo/keto reductase [Gammaproteobacteria bacterium]|nr:aldo/keto reductase [Gammaproteobacteria bacterium]NNC97952.1 aldo/keto reductase [Gammaproteobacteria bacterium]NNM13785.1 aldo/keto reductase [Gammaproteobacteria bacterium]
MSGRRQFLQGIGAGLLGLGLPGALQAVTKTPIADAGFFRHIPKTAETIPVIGLGTSRTFHVDINNKSAMQQRMLVVKTLLEQGCSMIDSSPMYANAEEVIGLCLDQISQDLQEKVFSTSKVWSLRLQDGIRKYAESETLWREKQFDLMQVHNLLNLSKTLALLQKYKAEERVRYIGVTTSHRRRHKDMLEIMNTQDIDFVQFSYNIDNRLAEEKLFPAAQKNRLAVIINRGFQTGYLFERVADKDLPDWANEIGVQSWAQFFLKFIISHPAVTVVIPATRNPAHMLENIHAARGPLPDNKMRHEMIRYFDSVAR